MPQFINGKLWRFVVADLACATITLLDHLASSRNVTYTLNAPAVASGNVPSDNPEVNIIEGGSLTGDPFLSYSDRLLFGFRREGPDGSNAGPWIIRFAGILMQLEDAAQSDDAVSTYTAYDPWQYLMSRPVRNPSLELPGTDGLSYNATPGSQIARDLIVNTIAADGSVFVDVDGGTLETTADLDINFTQGSSVGDALTQLCNTGTMDIWFSPVYDPVSLPGIIANLNTYVQQGSEKDGAIMSWDSPSKSLVAISRLLDGSQLANNVQFYNGQGGPPVALQTDAASVAKYGSYWGQQFQPVEITSQAVIALAQMQLLLRQIGRRTLTVNPAPERSPEPFTEYFLGDLVPVYATNRLRQPIPTPSETTNYQRVYAIPIDISDNALETVTQLLTSPDGFSP